MNSMMFLFITFIALIYYLMIIRFYIGLLRLKPGDNQRQNSIAVIIPARNEQDNINKCLESLLNQDYPPELFQIVVVDDYSMDKTCSIVASLQEKHPDRIQLYKLEDHDQPPAKQINRAYKKAAIQHGIQQTLSDLIFTIDADCRAKSTWLSTMNSHFYNNVGMACGYILLSNKRYQSLFYKLQALEFLGLISAGAGSLGLGQPITCNGANLAYRRSAFEEVDGFRGIDFLPSGDDDLLMHKIHNKTEWKIRFVAEKEALNYTEPEATFRQFINQRTRWASKSLHYQNRTITLILILVYIFYAYLLAGFFYSLFYNFTYKLPLILFSVKWLTEFWVIKRACTLTGRTDLLKYFPIAQFFQIFYVLIAGFWGIFGKYTWKGRTIKN